jgi:ubiquinone/menaquinone biosynthesis C-methylase UbiE
MAEPTFGPLRLFEASVALSARGPAPPLAEAPPDPGASLGGLAERLADQEILRGPLTRAEPVEPLSLPWYLQLEQTRHNRQGRWIPALLEFGKHQGERLLGLGNGLGSDLIQYARQGAEVFAACPSAEQLALVRRNFELRGLTAQFLHAAPHAIPVESSAIDVVCITGLLHESNEPGRIVEEVYRVLKPGGKVLAVVPAYYDIDYWTRLLLLRRGRAQDEPWREASGLLAASAGRFKRKDLKRLFHRFQEPRISKRHLRRAEVPHLWRWMPLSLMERLAGRLLVYKGFKPVSAARGDHANYSTKALGTFHPQTPASDTAA